MKQLWIYAMLFFFLSCNDLEKNIQGIWVSSYSQNVEENKRWAIPAKKIIEFSNDSVFIRGVKDFPYSDYKGKYVIKGKKILFDDSMNLHAIDASQDSLVFSNNNKSQTIYKRLSDSLKNKSEQVQFTGKMFSITYQRFRDTVTFVNDSVLISKRYGNLKRNWELINYKDYDILMIDDNFDLPLIIRNTDENNIYLTMLYTYSESIKMVELDNIN